MGLNIRRILSSDSVIAGVYVDTLGMKTRYIGIAVVIDLQVNCQL